MTLVILPYSLYKQAFLIIPPRSSAIIPSPFLSP